MTKNTPPENTSPETTPETVAAATTPRPSFFSRHRGKLLAGAAVLLAGAFAVGAVCPRDPHRGALVTLPGLTSAAFAEDVQRARPVGFGDVVDKVKPAVVSVKVSMAQPRLTGFDAGDEPMPRSFERFFREWQDRSQGPRGEGPRGGHRRGERDNLRPAAQGSGFFISPDGYIVTNNHVVENADAVEVTLDDGRTVAAKVIGTDPRTDLALLKADITNASFVRLADKAPRVGDWVVAIGNPFGLGGTVTAGIVSARGRDIGAGPYDDFLQIDAPVNRGNSGGPSFDVDGDVVGVNTAIFSPSGGSVGIAFAIPAETVRKVVADLKDKGSVERGWIGVEIQPVTREIADAMELKEAAGALIGTSRPGTPAARAGLQSGDIVTAVDGQPIREARELARRIGARQPGETVKLTILRKGKNEIVEVRLDKMPRRI